MINLCNRIIEYSFYALFFFVPLVFASNTSELFEFNKMWVTFTLAIIIAASWSAKIILQKKIIIQRTLLDIPILLFLLSHVISTILSLDFHVSLWGYYSRFNGGFLSIATYIFLYYAFVSNLRDITENSKTGALLNTFIKRVLAVSLITGAIVTIWGIPSHFGRDPTCLLIRGTFDVSCWTENFQPKIRIFSTLGQPNWMAAYLAILLPIAFAFGLITRSLLSRIFWGMLVVAFYAAILFTDSRSGFYGLVGALFVFASFYIWHLITNAQSIRPQKFYIACIILAALFLSLYTGRPYSTPLKPILNNPLSVLQPKTPLTTTKEVAQKTELPTGTTLETNITDSGKIRRIVWSGAIDIWKNYPIFGSGVSTFAYAYYKYRPAEHNLTSEWDYLYNKAHGELFDYLATTGIFGLGSYLAIIGVFLFIVAKRLILNIQYQNPKQYQNRNDQISKRLEYSHLKHSDLSRISNFEFRILSMALVAGYISIFITNALGFSIVITNIYLFLIPAFVLALQNMLGQQRIWVFPKQISNFQWIGIACIILVATYLLFILYRFWDADTKYALGYNLDKVGQYQEAHNLLTNAVEKRPGEPLFRDELSVNKAVLAVAYATNKDTTKATQFKRDAVMLSDGVVNDHPNNLVFWKSRVRVFYTLSQLNPQYLQFALEAIQKAKELAPTDAKITYNLGILYGQTGNSEKAAEVLEETIKLKRDYSEAYYALGLFYHDLAVNKGKPELQEKAVEIMKYILKNFNPKDGPATTALTSWNAL